ncbi:tetratricopeptide repeat protein [Streptomyces boluensis]|uniref:Tetratricopeptide repeat protein n=1 Tax=Streptomyces boluensis TaxID=1775135 RepID=A0A964XML0_9ACTN|nr:tetratricopeptide repeat protein [Streptomyces boluensis]NBE53271.1 tetratricopeptide repeat protein [Streptomyces boluensis]
MTDRFESVRPDGRATDDRWTGALHLFDDGPEGAVTREEPPGERWERAQLLFGEKKFTAAAGLLDGLVEEFPEHSAARLLLARAYYHSAQLRRAEAELRTLIARDPVDSYAHLMLGRTLERQSRAAEAAPWLRMAGAFTDEG